MIKGEMIKADKFSMKTALALILLISSCGSWRTKVVSENSSEKVQFLSEAKLLQGKWLVTDLELQECLYSDKDKAISQKIETRFMPAGQFIQTQSYFTDESCKQFQFMIVKRGHYHLEDKGEKRVFLVTQAREHEIVYRNSERTPASIRSQGLSAQKKCNIKNSAKDSIMKKKSIKCKSFNGSHLHKSGSANERDVHFFKIVNNEDEKVFGQKFFYEKDQDGVPFRRWKFLSP